MKKKPVVAIIMGSDSDMPVMSETVNILIVLEVVCTMPEHQDVIDELLKYALLAEDQTDFEQVT